jgi:uncharacterized protein YgiM (DUF1202 family)
MTHAHATALDTRVPRLSFVTFLLLAALLLAFLSPALVRDAAASVSVGQAVTVATDVLHVRAAPGTGSAIVDRLYEGDTVTICAVDGYANGYTWAQVSRVPGNPIGWVAADYLGSGPADGGATMGFTAGDRVLVDAGALNFRTAPSTSATVIRPLAYGTLLTIMDGPVSADGYTWYQGKTTAATGGDIGWAIGQAMMDPCLQFDAGATAHVNTDVLRLRSAPAMSGAVLADLPQGTTLTVTGMPVGADGYTWYPVTTSAGTAGWVAGMYLAGGSGGSTSGNLVIGSPARVDAGAVNFRTGPGFDAGIQDQLSMGTWLMLVSGPQSVDGYHWYQVDTANGQTGWVIGEALVPER